MKLQGGVKNDMRWKYQW